MNKTVPPKGVRLWKLERGPRNIKQAKKRYQNKGRHTRILRMALELDDQIKKNSTTGKCCGPENVFVPQFMLICIFKIWLWNLICKIFRILSKIWLWNHSKRMHQLFLIIFAILVFSYASCSASDLHTDFKRFIIFLCWFFWTNSFFVLSITLQTCIYQRIKIFLWVKIFFWNKTASTENLKQGILETGNKKQQDTKI